MPIFRTHVFAAVLALGLLLLPVAAQGQCAPPVGGYLSFAQLRQHLDRVRETQSTAHRLANGSVRCRPVVGAKAASADKQTVPQPRQEKTADGGSRPSQAAKEPSRKSAQEPAAKPQEPARPQAPPRPMEWREDANGNKELIIH